MINSSAGMRGLVTGPVRKPMLHFRYLPEGDMPISSSNVRSQQYTGKHLLRLSSSQFDPSATLGRTQESAQSHVIGGMIRPGGDVMSLRAYVQLLQHVSDELLHVLMATVVEGDARALSVGQWCGGHDPIRADDDGLIVRLRELHECHERSILRVGREPRAAPRNLRRAGVKVKPVCRKRKGEALQMACCVCAPDAPSRFPVKTALIYAVEE